MGAKYVGFLSFQNWEIQFVHFCVETVLSENPDWKYFRSHNENP